MELLASWWTADTCSDVFSWGREAGAWREKGNLGIIWGRNSIKRPNEVITRGLGKRLRDYVGEKLDEPG